MALAKSRQNDGLDSITNGDHGYVLNVCQQG